MVPSEAVKFAQLGADLCKKTGGCNVARHADVAANRKRRALTEAEREHEIHSPVYLFSDHRHHVHAT